MEMNLHLPQSIITAEEISRLAMVSTQIVSPQAYKPIIGLVQDSLLGIYRMSSEHVRGFEKDQVYYMNPRQFMRLVVWLNNYAGKMPAPLKFDKDGRMGWTTRQLMNMFMPHVSMKSGGLSIKNGVIAEPATGTEAVPMGKKVVGKGAGGGLIHISWNDLGPSATRDLLDNFSRLSSQWLLIDGFSVGLSDVEIMASVLADIERIKNEYMDGARELIEGLHLGKYDETRDRIIKQPRGLAKNDYEQFEVDIMYHLGDCKSKIEKLTVDNLTSVHADNRIRSMVDSGSKGSSANVVQIAAALGQQDIGGKRIANSYTRRPFPHVPKDDLSPETRGFCRNCFIAGLSPIEYITHAMAGRIGVISTSIKTAETGYIQRKLVKVLEDVMVMYDGTVRNAAYMIIQHLYGGDGFDGAKIEPQRLDHLTMANDEFAVTFKYSDADVEDLKIMMSDEAYARFESERVAQLAVIAEETKRVEEDRKVVRSLYKHNIPEHFLSPVNFARLIKHTSFRLGIKANVPSDLTPKEIITEVNNTINSLRVSENGRINEVCTRNIRALMRSYLHSKKLLFAEKFTREALVYLLTSIKVKFNDALISPGEAVGPIAAQSIGEPSTQMSSTAGAKLLIQDNGVVKQVKIGEFIDKLMKDNSGSLIDLGSDSTELRTNDLYIHSVDPKTEVAHWSKVRTVSRHPANGGLVRVKTATGRETTTTLSHSHLARDSINGIVPVKGSKLKVGDRIPIAMELPLIDKPMAEIEHNGTKFKLTPMMGWLLGVYTAEGCINGAQVHISNVSDEYEENIKTFCTEYGCTYRVQICNGEYGPSKTLAIKGGRQLADFVGDSCGRGLFNKKVPEFMFGTDLPAISAYIRGAMDGDGNIMGTKGHETVRYGSRSKELVESMALLFSYFGIFATISEEEVKGGKPFYWAIVMRKHIKKYRDQIGVDIASKKKKLEDAVAGISSVKKTMHEYTDMIPVDTALATALADCGRKLCMDGASRTYGRWLRQEKTTIGRATLGKYIIGLTAEARDRPRVDVSKEMELLQRAYDTGVLWDEITELEILEDPKEYVYDLTVPGTESFMVDAGVFVHNTLDTFHHAGIGAKANVSRGVPRLKEIMSLAVKPKTPAIITYLNRNVIRHLRVGTKTIEALDAELRAAYMSANLTDKAAKEALKHTKEDMQQGIIKAVKKIKSEYDYVTFKDIVRKIEVVYDENDEDTVIEEDQGFLRAYWEVCKATSGEDMAGSPWVLRFELDPHKLADHNIELYQIEYAFNSDPMIRNKIQCIFSDDNAQKVVCRARITDVGSNPTMIIDALEGSLLSKKIKGVPGISKTSIRIEKSDIRTDAGAIISQYDSEYSDATLSTVDSEEYVIDTVGSNLLEILNMPYVDATRTVSNNIYEIFDVYGVEGARQVIINEIMEVMEYAGASVGRRHVELLADIMTSRGILQSVDRFGVKKGETGPWARASFEETTPHMVQAAAFSEIDNMKGVSANVMFGQFPRVGTNSFTVGLDEAMISKLEAIKEEEEFDIDVTVANAADDIALCDKENFEFNFSL